MSRAQRWVLMGDPTHFSVKGGANPHTRTRWGTRRQVDKQLAIAQWHTLKAVLEDLGIRVLVVPPVAEWPGTVYPANAGVMLDVDTPKPPAEKRFILANLLPTREGEKPHYARVLEEHGIPTEELAPTLRFEGEADLFPAADVTLFTYGRIERQRFTPALAWPPWRRVYGFRSDAHVRDIMAPYVAPREILTARLVLEAHYHGDTALCAFGPHREHLLAYRQAIASEDWPTLTAHFGDALIELTQEDAERYAANAFTYTPPDPQSEGLNSYFVLPAGLSPHLLAQIRDRNVTPIEVDVSEFMKKGGGSVKCMIGDLGVMVRI